MDFEAYCLVWWHVVARFLCKLSIYDIVKVTLRHLYLRAEWKGYMNVFMLIQDDKMCPNIAYRFSMVVQINDIVV